MQTKVFKEVGGHNLNGIVYSHLQFVYESVYTSLAVYLVHTFRNRVTVCTAFMTEDCIYGRYQVVKDCKVGIIVEHANYFIYRHRVMHLVRKDCIVLIRFNVTKPEVINEVWQKIGDICLEFLDGFF